MRIEDLSTVEWVLIGTIVTSVLLVIVLTLHHLFSKKKTRKKSRKIVTADELSKQQQIEANQQAQAAFQRAIDDNVLLLRRDIHQTGQKLISYMQQEISKALHDEISVYKKNRC